MLKVTLKMCICMRKSILKICIFMRKHLFSEHVHLLEGLDVFILAFPRGYKPLIMLNTAELSGRVFDSRPRGRGFESHRRHCIVSLSKTH